jgi:hypothetical protein
MPYHLLSLLYIQTHSLTNITLEIQYHIINSIAPEYVRSVGSSVILSEIVNCLSTLPGCLTMQSLAIHHIFVVSPEPHHAIASHLDAGPDIKTYNLIAPRDSVIR